MTAAASLTREELIAEVEHLRGALATARLLIEKLELDKRKALLAKYGAKGETLSNLQLALLELEPGAHSAEAEGEANQAVPPAGAPRTRKKVPGGRQKLPAHLPREEKIVGVPAGQLNCTHCGRATEVIGYEESERLETIPARHFVLVTKREKRACPCCRKGVATAPAPARIVDKSLLGDSTIVDVLVRKYSDHCPLYRQSGILSRDSGVEIGTATLDGIVMRVGEMLIPLAALLRRRILESGYVQADETPIAVQQRPGKKGRHHQGYLWQYGTPGGETVFDFRMGRSREGPAQVLQDFDGILQTDGYTAYDQCGRRVLRAACWAHARRGFAEALKLDPADGDAETALRMIHELFAVDAEARDRAWDHAARHRLRQERSRPALERLQSFLRGLRARALPSSAAGRAAAYTLNLWDRLALFLEQPRLELSNNLAENSMRPLALGRKNWIHLGHPAAGPRVAAVISLVESCRRLDVPIRRYFADILPGLDRRVHRQLDPLTPRAWAAAHN